jgi:hypothetical protein
MQWQLSAVHQFATRLVSCSWFPSYVGSVVEEKWGSCLRPHLMLVLGEAAAIGGYL